jgi:hypothetical protein
VSNPAQCEDDTGLGSDQRPLSDFINAPRLHKSAGQDSTTMEALREMAKRA